MNLIILDYGSIAFAVSSQVIVCFRFLLELSAKNPRMLLSADQTFGIFASLRFLQEQLVDAEAVSQLSLRNLIELSLVPMDSLVLLRCELLLRLDSLHSQTLAVTVS